jgi:hypothetical protein
MTEEFLDKSGNLVARLEPGAILAFDLDGTLCTKTENGDYHLAKPIMNNIAKVNQLYEKGYIIKIYTARGQYSGTNRMDLTARQLVEWGVKYHELLTKTAAHLYIDDLAMRPDEFFR